MFLQSVARMRQVEGEVAVVGEQEQAAGIVVQASHWIDALLAQTRGQQIKYGCPVPGDRRRLRDTRLVYATGYRFADC